MDGKICKPSFFAVKKNKTAFLCSAGLGLELRVDVAEQRVRLGLVDVEEVLQIVDLAGDIALEIADLRQVAGKKGETSYINNEMTGSPACVSTSFSISAYAPRLSSLV